MTAPTLFRFVIDYEDFLFGGRSLSCRSIWAPNAKTALSDFRHTQAGIKGFLRVESIDPVPTHVRLEEDDYLAAMGEFDRACALIRLAEQSGVSRTADVLAFLVELREKPEEISKRLIAEWRGEETGAELARSLSTAA